MNSVTFGDQKVYPSKIVCVGRNYVEHIEELDNEIPEQPVIFLKPNSSISNGIVSSKDEVIHYEGEITFLIRSGEIAGVGFGLDLTKREVQANLKSKGLPWERAKAFDQSAVFSNFVVHEGDVNALRMELLINGRLVQSGGCTLMLYKPAAILNDVKRFLSFEDGDLLMTGTPKGIGPISPGDTFTGTILEGTRVVVEGSWVAL